MYISVIVPFYNAEHYLEACIQSLRTQTLDRHRFEIIFVNNGSSDRSCDIVRQYPDLQLLHEKKPGSYAARNCGLRVARGEIVAFTDADCVVAKDWLSRIEDGMQRTRSALVLGKRLFPPHVSNWLRIFQHYENAKVSYVVGLKLRPYFFGFTNNMAVQREVFDRVGMFREWKRAADTEFVQRCIAHDPAIAISYLPEVQITHLEITTVTKWLCKMGLYGESNERVRRLFNYRKLKWKDNWQIICSCAEEIRTSIPHMIPVLLLMALSDVAYRFGVLKGMLRVWIPFRRAT
ncbi:MAG: glycosyltransferase family 2 protein [Candidatus Omnitrophica bacterium]|nr:glycosyltransferase family 2 protein [Candidatus Omnitrophota bacterium]